MLIHQTDFHPALQTYLDSLYEGESRISDERKEILREIADYIHNQISGSRPAELVFICTHNSRRSQFGQIWAKVLADYHQVSVVNTYSGGTEATAFHPNAIDALRSMGFQIKPDNHTGNPRYSIYYAKNKAPLWVWSKVYTDPANPEKGFCAIMTCSEADEACPAVHGALRRIALPYEDPKKSDDTPEQMRVYLTRCQQIATELNYVFQLVAS